MTRQEEEELKEQILEAIWETAALNGDAGEQKYILPAVYTFYDAEGKPLYIGASQWLDDRFDWHRRRPYWKLIKKIGIRIYPDREQMRLAELALIFAKRPKYNRDGIYDDGREPLFFGMPGFAFVDKAPEAVFRLNEFLYGNDVPEWPLSRYTDEELEAAGKAAAERRLRVLLSR